jgi:P27 family predicted phage terminase small subunit
VAGANAGRKSTPPALRIVGGRGPGRDSGGRKVPDAPAFARAVPTKPSDLTPVAAGMWDAIVAELPALQLLKPLDGFALQVGCETFSRWHAAKSARIAVGGNGQGLLAKTSQGMGVSPLVRVEAEASKDFRAWCAEFGLTPAAEVKLASLQDPAGGARGDLF